MQLVSAFYLFAFAVNCRRFSPALELASMRSALSYSFNHSFHNIVVPSSRDLCFSVVTSVTLSVRLAGRRPASVAQMTPGLESRPPAVSRYLPSLVHGGHVGMLAW